MTTKNYNLKRLNEISKFDEIELLILEKNLLKENKGGSVESAASKEISNFDQEEKSVFNNLNKLFRQKINKIITDIMIKGDTSALKIFFTEALKMIHDNLDKEKDDETIISSNYVLQIIDLIKSKIIEEIADDLKTAQRLLQSYKEISDFLIKKGIKGISVDNISEVIEVLKNSKIKNKDDLVKFFSIILLKIKNQESLNDVSINELVSQKKITESLYFKKNKKLLFETDSSSTDTDTENEDGEENVDDEEVKNIFGEMPESDIKQITINDALSAVKKIDFGKDFLKAAGIGAALAFAGPVGLAAGLAGGAYLLKKKIADASAVSKQRRALDWFNDAVEKVSAKGDFDKNRGKYFNLLKKAADKIPSIPGGGKFKFVKLLPAGEIDDSDEPTSADVGEEGRGRTGDVVQPKSDDGSIDITGGYQLRLY